MSCFSKKLPTLSACATCTVSEIELVPGDDATLVTPTITTPTVGSDGCLVTTVTCDVTDMPGTVTFMNVSGVWIFISTYFFSLTTISEVLTVLQLILSQLNWFAQTKVGHIPQMELRIQ